MHSLRSVLMKNAIGAAVLCMASTALAEGTDTALATNTSLGAGDLASFIISMLVVVTLIVALGWVYSRFRFSGNHRNQLINIVASRALGQKERLLLVQVADKQLLVGMTASQVQTLHVFEQPIVPERSGTDATPFRRRLRAAVLEGAQ